MIAGKGMAAAEVSRGHFDLQLHFAETLAAKKPMPLVEAITFHTNLHRRFAYGNLSKQPADPDFLALADRLAALPDHAARLDLTVAAFAERDEEGLPPHLFDFGCFRCEAPDERGHIRIHFGNRDSDDGLGPLDKSKTARRRDELTRMIRFVAGTYPHAKAVDGGSWLYNTEAYRRLFPPEFANSRTPLEGPRSTHGSSSWGQFLDFRGNVKPDMSEKFMQNLKLLDPQRPWLAFPLPVLMTTAPFEAFRREYGL
jgi:hypothetical protein